MAHEQSACDCQPGRGWKVWQSLWMVPVLVGLGFFSWAGFVYVAARTRRAGHVAIALAFTASALILTLAIPTDPEADNGTVGLMLLMLWAAAIAIAFAINPSFLRRQWDRHHACPRRATSSEGLQASAQPNAGSASMPLIQDLPRHPNAGDAP